jgi:hypothetical protein
LNAQKITQVTKILEFKDLLQFSNRSSNAGRRGANDKDIIYINQKIKMHMAMVIKEQGAVNG